MSTLNSYGPVFTQQELSDFGPRVIFEKARRRLGRPVVRIQDAVFAINYDLQDARVLRGAAKSGCIVSMVYMLDTIHIPREMLDYAFAIACGYGQVQAARILLEYGADPHADEDNAYRWALETGKTEVLSLLKTL